MNNPKKPSDLDVRDAIALAIDAMEECSFLLDLVYDRLRSPVNESDPEKIRELIGGMILSHMNRHGIEPLKELLAELEPPRATEETES